MTPVLVLEINEVPWRLIDKYIDDVAFPNLREFFGHSHQFTSVTVDIGELSPWVTWPSMHRGMSNEEHGVLNLGQDPATFRGTPIWQELRNDGMTIGICGPMQSWPPTDPGKGGFFVPDTFAHDSSCIPSYLEPLQALNLAQVKKNPRVVSTALPSISEVRMLFTCAMRAGIGLRTIIRIAAQLLRERIHPIHSVRRPVFQTILFWDVFRKHYRAKSPPAYASFFTNHVAGVMHRYWKDVFPEDFSASQPGAKASNEPLMRFALSVLDDMLKDVLNWRTENPNVAVVFASSMGQGPVHRTYHEGIELHITNIHSLLACAGVGDGEYAPLLAMVPQVAAEIHAKDIRERAISFLSRCKTSSGKSLFKIQEIGVSLSITVALPSRAEISNGYASLDGKTISYAALGLSSHEVDAGSGYHIPEGTFAVLLPGHNTFLDRSRRSFARRK